MSLDVWELQSKDDDGFASLVEIYRADLAARDPGDLPPSERFIASTLFGLPADRVRFVHVAELDGRAAGFATTTAVTDANGDVLAEVELYVAAELHRQGIGTAMLRRILPSLSEANVTSVVAYPCLDLWPDGAIGMCARLGMTRRQEERCSRSRVADIDDALMAQWIVDAVTKAAGYRIEQWEGACPDHLLDAWCKAAAGMEDAPLDELDYAPTTRDPELQREADEAFRQRGYLLYRTLALAPGGEPAGLTALLVHADRPQVGHQDDTAVLAGHRGHGIGRWLKAANYRQTVAAHPELAVIETYNAQSNPWMLDINIAMGFEPHHVYAGYQAPIEMIVEALERLAAP